MGFSSLGLDSSLLENLKRLGYHGPTPVQREAIPAALAGGDLLVSSQTGSGKTAAFVLPGLQRLRTPAKTPGNGPRMLVLAPTRELAMQVQKAIHGYCSGQQLLTTLLVGGMPFGLQLAQVRKAVDIAIATPGRLKDHMDRGSVDLARVELLVLDEADRMLDMGFQEEIDSILARVPKARQTLLFSATLAGVVGQLAGRVTRSPKRIEIKAREETKLDITQHALIADNQEHKVRMLDALLRETDVAARGIDVPGINLVVNYDAPRLAEDYVHRIGRTGRAGRAGVAVTFLGREDRSLVRQIERFTGHKVSMMEIEGLEPRSRIDEQPKWRKKAPRPHSGSRAQREGYGARRYSR